MKRIFKLFCVLMLIVLLCGLCSAANAENTHGTLSRGDVISAFYSWDNMYFRSEWDSKSEAFADVEGTFYAGASNWALQNGLVTGTSSGLFSGDNRMTKAELAVLICRYANMKGVELDEADLSEYSDVDMIPEWALKSVASGLNMGLINAQGDKLNYPMGFITKKELDLALLEFTYVYLEPSKALPRPEQVNYQSLTLISSEDGEEIYLGMGIDEISKILGVTLENWFASINDCVRVQISNNHAAMIAVTDECWVLGNSLKIGSGKEVVEKMFGEPVRSDEPGYTIPQNTSVYLFDSNGTLNKNKDEFAFLLLFEFDRKDTITEILLSTSNPYAAPQNIDFLCPYFGIVFQNVSGKGSGCIQVDTTNIEGPIFDINHTGTGDIVISDCCSELFRHSGEYNGRVLLNNISESGQINIDTDGEWTIKSIEPSGVLYNNPISGNGDFVHYNVLAPHLIRGYDKVRITHNGDGRFLVRLKTRYPDTQVEPITIADGIGIYDALCDIPQSNPMYYIEIVADGGWSIELVKSE